MDTKPLDQISARLTRIIPTLEKIARTSFCSEEQLQDLNSFYSLVSMECESIFGTRSYTKLKPFTNDVKRFVLDLIGYMPKQALSSKERKDITSKALLLINLLNDVRATLQEEAGYVLGSTHIAGKAI